MRYSHVMLAGLASSALALPTASPELDTRTFGLVGGLLETVKDILGGTSPAHILGGISAEAAAALGGSALGCKAGSIDLEYRKKLAVWIKEGAGVNIEASLKKGLLAWCEADASVDLDLDLDLRAQLSYFIPTCANIAAEADLYVSLEGVFSLATDVIGVLTASAQSALEGAIHFIGELDWKIRVGLEFCAAGGVIGNLDVEIIDALKVWLNSKECTLSVELKQTILAWIGGKIGGDVIEIPSLPVGGITAISLGHSIEALVGSNGVLVGSAQTSFGAFLETDYSAEIDVEIKKVIHVCAKGGHATDIELEKRVELTLWLASSECSLTAELKSLLAFWLSFGVSSSTEVSVDVSTNIATELTGFLSGTVESQLGSQLHGLISFLLTGKGVLSISLEARAQIAALISGGCGVEIDVVIQKIIIGWLSGCHKCCGGSTPSNTPGLPSSTATLTPTPTNTKPTTTPTGTKPTETPAVPTDVQPSETPSASTTPCDTLTSGSVTSYTVSESETPSVPAETPSGPAETPSGPAETPSGPAETPSGPAETPSGPAETPSAPTDTPAVPTDAQPSETPCDTLTSGSVTSYTVSETETPAVPAVPTDAEPSETPDASTTPCDTLTSASVSSYTVSESETPSVPTETPAVPTDAEPTESASETPCDTLTSATVSSYTVSETETPSAPTDTPAVPVVPTETTSVPTDTASVPGSEPSETPCDTLTSATVSSYTVSESETPSVPTETPAVPTDAEPTESASETPCDTLTSATVSSYTVSETETPSAPTDTPAVPVVPTETTSVPTDTASVPGSEPSETPCDTLTSDNVTSYTVSETPAAPTDVEPTGTPAVPTITEAPGPSGSSTDSILTVTVTKTVGVEACPPEY